MCKFNFQNLISIGIIVLSVFVSNLLFADNLRLEHDEGYIDFSGRIQGLYNYRFLFNEDDDYKNNCFRMKQVRFNIKGEFHNNFNFKLSIEYSNDEGIPESRDLWVSYTPIKPLKFKFGQFKTPVSRSRLTSGGRLLFAKRPTVASDDFVPGRDIGVMIKLLTENKKYSISFGAFTGKGLNQLKDDSEGMPLIAGRIEVMPFGRVKKGEGDKKQTQKFSIVLGLNGTYSEDAGPAVDEEGSIRTINGKKILYGGDFTVKYRGFFFSSEIIMAYFEPKNGFDYYAGGFYLQSSYYIRPVRLEPAIRYDEMNPSDQIETDRQKTITFGINYFPFHKSFFKVQFNYLHRLPSTDEDQNGFKENEIRLLTQFAFN